MEFDKEIFKRHLEAILNKHKSAKGITWPAVLNFTHEARTFSNELFGERSLEVLPKFDQNEKIIKMIIYVSPDPKRFGYWFDYHFIIPSISNEQ